MKILDELFHREQYSMPPEEKNSLLLDELWDLTRFHAEKCPEYNNIIRKIYRGLNSKPEGLEQLPYFPVRLFKLINLKSIPDTDVMRTLASSGTTSMQVSRIFVDRDTSMLQTRALASIVTSFIGPKRLPMLIVDTDASISRASLSARGAGLVGLSNFGRNHFYALNEKMELNMTGVLEFVEKYGNEPVLLFGFTFMVWQNFYSELKKHNIKLNLDKGILIHSGGWKKLQDIAVGNEQFKTALREQCGIERVHNFYGMVEQVGSIYMECEHSYLHAPNFSDIITRNFHDWCETGTGETGVIQTMSVLPRSYPGHSILTEDIGIIHGRDGCPCGRRGTYFTVEGRIPQAELRGCSDVYADGNL